MVVTRRLDIIALLLRPIQTAVDKLLMPGNFGPGWNTDFVSPRARCEALMLGKLIQFLASVGLWPIPDPYTYQHSAMHLMKILRTLSVGSTEIEHTHNHRNCFPIPNLKKTLDAIANGDTHLTIPEQRRRLSAQAKKSGLRLERRK